MRKNRRFNDYNPKYRTIKRDRRKLDPTYRFPYDIFYSTDNDTVRVPYEIPVKADHNGIYHTVEM